MAENSELTFGSEPMLSRRDEILLATVIGCVAATYTAMFVGWVLCLLTFPITWPDGNEKSWGWIGSVIFAIATTVGALVGGFTGRSWYLRNEVRK